MSTFDSLNELIRKGDEILRIPRPPLRQRQWRRWHDQVVNSMQDIPALKEIGLHLRANYLAADVGILSRYSRLMAQKPKVAEQIAISEHKNKGQRYKRKKPYSKKDDNIRIFISHKHEDERTAIGVKAAIERYGAGRVEIFISEDIPSGENWNNWIKMRLLEAQILILIFTDITRTCSCERDFSARTN